MFEVLSYDSDCGWLYHVASNHILIIVVAVLLIDHVWNV